MFGLTLNSLRSKLAVPACLGVGALMFSSLVGCGGDQVVTAPSNPAVSDSTSQTAATGDSSVQSATEKATGIWLGGAYLDQTKLQELAATKTDAEGQALMQRAQSFLSTVMAIEFAANGEMVNEVEITPHGMQTIVEASAGTWKVVEADAERMVVETETETADGTMAKDQKVYNFYADGNHFALQVPYDEELNQCEPLIIFERQNIEGTVVAEVPPTNLTK